MTYTKRWRFARFAGTTVGAGAGVAAWSLVEPRLPRLMVHDLDVAAGRPPLDVLHISDLHLKARDGHLVAFVESLPDRLPEPPDLVLATGDLIEENDGIAPVVAALNLLPARLGRFYVLGSHDYYQARFKSFTHYFRGSRQPANAVQADTPALERGLQEAGWRSLTNRTEFVDAEHGRIRLAGVDDPYLNRHDTGHIARAGGDVYALALVHAPDVVSEWALHGYDLVVAGHTHAGQVRLPFVGALVTNCSLPNALAGGLSRVGGTWLHVSPGLGQGKFAPIRLANRPEVTLLRLRPSE